MFFITGLSIPVSQHVSKPASACCCEYAFVWRVTSGSNRGVIHLGDLWKHKCPPLPLIRSSVLRPPRSGPSHLLQNLPPRSNPCFHRPSRSFPTAARHTNNWDWPARRVLPVVCPSLGSSCHHHHFRLPSSSTTSTTTSTTSTTTTLLDAQEFFHNVCGPHSERWQDSIHMHRE